MPQRGALVRKLAARASQGRLRLYHWLRENHDELVTARAELRSTWQDIAQVAAEAGQTDAKGDPPTAEAVRKAWKRLEADMQKEVRTASNRRPSNPPAPATTLSVVAASPVAPKPQQLQPSDQQPDPLPHQQPTAEPRKRSFAPNVGPGLVRGHTPNTEQTNGKKS